MNIEEFIAAHGFNPANTQEAQRHATRVQVVDSPASCLTPELAATYIGLSPVNAAFIRPALIGQSAYLQRLIVEIDFALSEISTEVKDHGYDVLIMQIKQGWWPRSCNPMKPKNVADCFRQLKGTPGNFAFLLKARLGTQSLKDVCQFIETDAQLRLAGDVFDSRVFAEAIAENGPLLAGLLERDLGL